MTSTMVRFDWSAKTVPRSDHLTDKTVGHSVVGHTVKVVSDSDGDNEAKSTGSKEQPVSPLQFTACSMEDDDQLINIEIKAKKRRRTSEEENMMETVNDVMNLSLRHTFNEPSSSLSPATSSSDHDMNSDRDMSGQEGSLVNHPLTKRARLTPSSASSLPTNLHTNGGHGGQLSKSPFTNGRNRSIDSLMNQLNSVTNNSSSSYINASLVNHDNGQNGGSGGGGDHGHQEEGRSMSPSTMASLMNVNLSQLQMQQLLQQQILSPSQLQNILQQQLRSALTDQRSEALSSNAATLNSSSNGLPEGLMHLQEQLQLNMVQQSQTYQQLTSMTNGTSSGSTSKSRQQLELQIHQLQVQQQQIMQQLHLASQQKQYLLGSLGPYLSELWKHQSASALPSPNTPASSQTSDSLDIMAKLSKLNSSSLSYGDKEDTKDLAEADYPKVLYGHGVCKWPGCEAICDDFQSFVKHLNHEHGLDDRSTAQARVQMQVVQQLELQLEKEKQRSNAMMSHLHIKQRAQLNLNAMAAMSALAPASGNLKLSSSRHYGDSQMEADKYAFEEAKPLNLSHSQEHSKLSKGLNGSLSPVSGKLHSSPPLSTLNGQYFSLSVATLVDRDGQLSPPSLGLLGHGSAGRHRLSDKTRDNTGVSDKMMLSGVGGLQDSPARRRIAERANLDITEEITRNREFYKNADVRPPFTYASLIRQSIIESPERQLTLNEIYNWFTTTFCYFRRNAATWKNAVRHNLSLHKCFMRVENVKGAVWTVDEMEFYKRRPQRLQERLPSNSSP
ncbi:Forkhead box protein P1 [Halotydeus destructor]|nr:Forkhead box protein P1 [Halotydeus destructor]